MYVYIYMYNMYIYIYMYNMYIYKYTYIMYIYMCNIFLCISKGHLRLQQELRNALFLIVVAQM